MYVLWHWAHYTTWHDPLYISKMSNLGSLKTGIVNMNVTVNRHMNRCRDANYSQKFLTVNLVNVCDMPMHMVHNTVRSRVHLKKPLVSYLWVFCCVTTFELLPANEPFSELSKSSLSDSLWYAFEHEIQQSVTTCRFPTHYGLCPLKNHKPVGCILCHCWQH